jgi:hypothetical protein
MLSAVCIHQKWFDQIWDLDDMQILTPPKRPKLEIRIDEKWWENLRDWLIQTLVYS